MKTKILLVNLFFFGLLFNSFSSENLPITNSEKKDINALEYVDGLYYHQNQLYTGMIYNIFSSKGPNQKSNDSYFDGELINGERHGDWKWYRNNEMSHKQVYDNGELISDVIIVNKKEVLDLKKKKDIQPH